MCEKHQHDTVTVAPPTTDTDSAVTSCCGMHAPAAPAAGGATDDLAECPVMPGSVVNKAEAEAAGLYRDHDGRRYWFCCAACGPMWDADPAAYAA